MDIERLRAIAREADEQAASTRDRGLRRLALIVGELADVLVADHDTITTEQASERLDIPPGAVRQLVRRGRLIARREGRELRIARESVEAFAVDRRPRKEIEK